MSSYHMATRALANLSPLGREAPEGDKLAKRPSLLQIAWERSTLKLLRRRINSPNERD